MTDEIEKSKTEVESEALARKEAVLRVTEEARIEKSKAEADAAGKGPSKPEKGTNPDG
jgi:hypothetical protein